MRFTKLSLVVALGAAALILETPAIAATNGCTDAQRLAVLKKCTTPATPLTIDDCIRYGLTPEECPAADPGSTNPATLTDGELACFGVSVLTKPGTTSTSGYRCYCDLGATSLDQCLISPPGPIEVVPSLDPKDAISEWCKDAAERYPQVMFVHELTGKPLDPEDVKLFQDCGLMPGPTKLPMPPVPTKTLPY